ncbi:MAG: nucleotide exchange factor GrpE [Deltaproteobacteria bacterium]|jgi:molecular chaperone GrpE|nr:nucleotide exchange factor GrpE [Deltaproteobacteria bacterium]
MSKKEKKEIAEEEIIEESNGETLQEEAVSEEDAAIEVDLVSELRQQLEDAQVEAAENLAGWQRAQAEFINYKKRIEREQTQLFENASARVIKRFLDVLDDLDRALQNTPENGEAAEWAAGIDLIYRKLVTVLENEGVTAMQVKGKMFDPTLHEAIGQEESADHESGQIIEEIQKGYLIGERVLRAALVRVAS